MTERAAGRRIIPPESNAKSRYSCIIWLYCDKYVESKMPFQGRAAANHEVGFAAMLVILSCSEEEADEVEEMDLSFHINERVFLQYMRIDGLEILKSVFPSSSLLLDIERFTMCDHRIKDLTPLRRLKKLKYLNLSQNQISDIRPLTSLHQLVELVLDSNSICMFPRVFNAILFLSIRIYTSCAVYAFCLSRITKSPTTHSRTFSLFPFHFNLSVTCSPWNHWISPITPSSCEIRRIVVMWCTSFTTDSRISSHLTVFPLIPSFPAFHVVVIMLQTLLTVHANHHTFSYPPITSSPSVKRRTSATVLLSNPMCPRLLFPFLFHPSVSMRDNLPPTIPAIPRGKTKNPPFRQVSATAV